MAKNMSEKERYKLEAYLKAGLKVTEIARLLKRCRATIYNEINRGTVELLNSDLTTKKEYLADTGQQKHDENAANKGRPLKIRNDMEFVKFVEYMTNDEKYSSYAIIQHIKNNNLKFKTEICERTLFNYKKNGVFLNITTTTKKKKTSKRTIALNNKEGRSIEERPKNANNREEYGHWELDTVVSGQKKGKSCLLVFTERVTREEIIKKIPSKKTTDVIKALDKIEKYLGAKKFRKTFLTITMDNGVEFLDSAGIEKSSINKKIQRTTTYYCHPFASNERGSNENNNRLIRKFIPKGTNIDNISEEEIKKIEDWINNLPRRIHNGKSALMLKNELLNKEKDLFQALNF